MDSHRSGSDELVYIKTERVDVTLKGPASHPVFEGVEIDSESAELTILMPAAVVCEETGIFGKKTEGKKTFTAKQTVYTFATRPMFFEQQGYQLVLECKGGAADAYPAVTFWHDNILLRDCVCPVGRQGNVLSGVLNFRNEIGKSDLEVRVAGRLYLKISIEVFPAKINYKTDYLEILEDVTHEIYSAAFDFLKKTFQGFKLSSRTPNTPVEFFAILQALYDGLLRSADMILHKPHHLLMKEHEVLAAHKVRRVDAKTLRWVQRHPSLVSRGASGELRAERVLAVRKHVTYDTRENQLMRAILLSIVKRIKDLRVKYCQLQRQTDSNLLIRLDSMTAELSRRVNGSFLKDVGNYELNSEPPMFILMAPGYRDLYRDYLILQHGLSICNDLFRISVKDLAQLYEYWCFIKLNSLMRNRYELVSSGIVKAHSGGIFTTLDKGKSSRVDYRNPITGEKITLTYNPTETKLPTVSQKPDNVLKLEKKVSGGQAGGSDAATETYRYVFDAKYKINPALPGTAYRAIYKTPGPETDDINTMHRYRDAIVWENSGRNAFERRMFGAYVLFPYANEEEYAYHDFYRSITTVNVGGLPFLPSSTALVKRMLDELIADSSESAFERSSLPVGIERRLAKVDWSRRDVLVGYLRTKEQLSVALEHRFYHIPKKVFDRTVSNSSSPIRYVALYQTERAFKANAGILHYGEVVNWQVVKRSEITEIPSHSHGSTEPYYRFEIKDWQTLGGLIAPKGDAGANFTTNHFLLTHATEMFELKLEDEEQYRLFAELKRVFRDNLEPDGTDSGFLIDGGHISTEGDMLQAYKGHSIVYMVKMEQFRKHPRTEFHKLRKAIMTD